MGWIRIQTIHYYVETLQEIYFQTLSLINSIYPTTIRDQSSASYAHAILHALSLLAVKSKVTKTIKPLAEFFNISREGVFFLLLFYGLIWLFSKSQLHRSQYARWVGKFYYFPPKESYYFCDIKVKEKIKNSRTPHLGYWFKKLYLVKY